MTARNDLDRQLDTFLRDGPTELPDASFEAVRYRTESTRQRVVIGPWRMPDPMNRFAAIGLGAAAVVVVLLIGTQVLGRPAPGGVGSAPSASPSPTSTATLKPSPSPSDGPALTQNFTSTMHGYSVSYPEGWIARPATEPWTDRPGVPRYVHPGYDVLDDAARSGELFLSTTSRPLGDSTPEEWVAAVMTASECTATEPITVDGATGLIAAEGCHELAAFTSAGRGYEISLYTPTSGERQPDPIYDRSWFEEVLATVRLHPEAALDAASSPSS